MKNYKNRIFDIILRDALEAKGAVLIEGAKWCGKTTTAEQIAKSVIYMNDPKHREQYLMTAQTNPQRLLAGANPRLIDEWQRAPELWDTIRFDVDHSLFQPERNDNAGFYFVCFAEAFNSDLKMKKGEKRDFHYVVEVSAR